MTFEKVSREALARFVPLFKLGKGDVYVSSIRRQYGEIPMRYVVDEQKRPLATMVITNHGLWCLRHAPNRCFVNSKGWIEGLV